jgi:hypothetical protein
MLFLLLCYSSTQACDPAATDKIVGPTSVCGNQSEFYTLSMDNCFVSILNIDVVGGIPIYPTSIGSTNFEVVWNSNNGNTPINGSINVLVWYQPGSCDPAAPAQQKTISMNVNIDPNNLSVSTPTAISWSRDKDKYTLSTTSSNATSYQWSNIVGGTIEGSSTGSSVVINASQGSCSISASVVGRRSNSCGTYSSSSVARNITIALPGTANQPTGPEEVNVNDITYYDGGTIAGLSTYSWELNASSTNYINFNSPSSPTWKLITVFTPNTTATERRELRVRGKNSCGFGPWSTPKVIWLNKYGGSVYVANEDITIFPNPFDNSGPLKIDMTTDEYTNMNIFDISGRMLNTFSLTETNEIDLSKYDQGQYILKFYGPNKAEVSRTLIIQP